MHVDAYRLDGPTELDDLDLDTDIDEAVTVVEWGEGVAESLSGDRLELSLHRHRDDARTVTLTPVGPRWRAARPGRRRLADERVRARQGLAATNRWSKSSLRRSRRPPHPPHP